MVKRIGGSRRKTRHKFKKKRTQKGKISLTRYLKQFEKGDKVHLGIDPSVHKGMTPRRFVGKVGEIDSQQGRSYRVKIKDGGKHKVVIIHPIHLKRSKQK